jgi:hypothetical protein
MSGLSLAVKPARVHRRLYCDPAIFNLAISNVAEAVTVDYEALPVVTGRRAVVERGAPLVHEDFGTHLLFEVERGNRLETEVATAGAARVVELWLERNRLCANYTCEIPILPIGTLRGAAGDYHKHHVADGLYPVGVPDAINMPYTLIDKPDKISLMSRFYRQTQAFAGPWQFCLRAIC